MHGALLHNSIFVLFQLARVLSANESDNQPDAGMDTLPSAGARSTSANELGDTRLQVTKGGRIVFVVQWREHEVCCVQWESGRRAEGHRGMRQVYQVYQPLRNTGRTPLIMVCTFTLLC